MPPPLRRLLFGPDDDGRVPATYALLDAAKAVNLAEAIESSGLEHACLFDGAARDDLATVAPWLVRLEEGAALTRHLFTRDPARPAPWHLWDRRPGILLRSARALPALRAHFRRFVRVRDPRGAWFYFRFWDPEVFAGLPEAMDPPDMAALMEGLDAVIVPRDGRALVIAPTSRP